ncbi:phage major capsid protein [Kyrpidia spormannii]|uniref:Phage major capsid protein, HK97 family n=2 Tax=Kyrpidia spormannii TaxID=2055160 RepID=A0ACA8Z946_9BACL|nr:phage major capsid protein [Kyrpidia spormannii]CAB3391645.1 Phage major capsid protein, HK97 family [Kyrpidia spormannii]CAB3392557.1 Phage major capsid protein, HK97 family [Kyrpidia spormannii]
MKFKTVQDAFNHYRLLTVEEIEKRTQEISRIVDTDPNADIQALNIELEGLRQAKENIEERAKAAHGPSFNPVTGMSFERAGRMPEGDIFASEEYRSAFFKHFLGQKMTELEEKVFAKARQEAEKRADSINTVSNSAAVLPTVTLNEVIAKARKQGGLISVARNFNIPAKVSVPVGTPATKALWHAEGTVVDRSSLTTNNVSFNAYEILQVFSMSAAVSRTSISAFEAYLTQELSASVMETIADALVNGTGVNQGTGVLPGITWDGTNSFTYPLNGTPSYKDFTKAMAMLKRGYAAGASWAMNNATLYNMVYGLTDTTGRPVFITDPKTEGIGYILGRPVVVDDFIPDGVILLGNFNYLGYNLPQGITLEVSRDSGFTSGLIDYRALAIADTKPLVSEAFVKLSMATA